MLAASCRRLPLQPASLQATTSQCTRLARAGWRWSTSGSSSGGGSGGSGSSSTAAPPGRSALLRPAAKAAGARDDMLKGVDPEHRDAVARIVEQAQRAADSWETVRWLAARGARLAGLAAGCRWVAHEPTDPTSAWLGPPPAGLQRLPPAARDSGRPGGAAAHGGCSGRALGRLPAGRALQVRQRGGWRGWRCRLPAPPAAVAGSAQPGLARMLARPRS